MLPGKNVTEEDVKATEARLAEAYAGFKQAIVNIPSEAVRPVTDTVRSHPFISVTAAAGAGYLAFRLLDLLMPRTKIITKEITVEPEIEVKGVKKVRETKKRSLASRLISETMALAMPYITSYVKNEVSLLLSRPRVSEAEPGEPAERVE